MTDSLFSSSSSEPGADDTPVASLRALATRLFEHGDAAAYDAWGHELIQRLHSLSSEEQTVAMVREIAQQLGACPPNDAVRRLAEDLVGVVQSFSLEETRREEGLRLQQHLLGHDTLHPHWRDTPFAKHLAFLTLSLFVTNDVTFRPRLVKRLWFLCRELPDEVVVVPRSWDELLEASRQLGQWIWEEETEEGTTTLAPLPTILGLLGRDFNRAYQREWSQAFFHRLLQRMVQLSPSPGREWALRELMFGLSTSHHTDTEEVVDWMRQVLEVAIYTEEDPSLIYEGMFLGFLGNKERNNAAKVAQRIPDSRLRDRAFVRLLEAWLEDDDPVEAVLCLREMQDATIRGEWAVRLSRNERVITEPVACASLLEEVAVLPTVTQQVMRQITEHPAFPPEARRAILEQSPRRPLSRMARVERLHELALLRPHLPPAIYREHRRQLLGLAQPPSSANQEESPMTPRVIVDRPHAYGEGLYLTPREHVQRNHFGEEVAGSRIEAWADFDELWAEIEVEINQRVVFDGTVQVEVLEFPIEVGISALVRLEEASISELGQEVRNGHPSLYCSDQSRRQPSRLLTVVVGPSHVEPSEIPDYEGHDLPAVLYTIYPGEPAHPFPAWETHHLPVLQSATDQALALLQQGQIERAKASLYETFLDVSGNEEASRFWSQHILVR